MLQCKICRPPSPRPQPLHPSHITLYNPNPAVLLDCPLGVSELELAGRWEVGAGRKAKHGNNEPTKQDSLLIKSKTILMHARPTTFTCSVSFSILNEFLSPSTCGSHWQGRTCAETQTSRRAQDPPRCNPALLESVPTGPAPIGSFASKPGIHGHRGLGKMDSKWGATAITPNTNEYVLE